MGEELCSKIVGNWIFKVGMERGGRGIRGAKKPRVNRRKKKKTDGSMGRRSTWSPRHWLLTLISWVAGTTCCPTRQASGTEGLGGSGWTSWWQRSSSGPEGRKRNTRPPAAPVEPRQLSPSLGPGVSALPWESNVGAKDSLLGSPALEVNSSEFL